MPPTPLKEVSVNSPVLSAVGSGRRVCLQAAPRASDWTHGVNALHEAHLLIFCRGCSQIYYFHGTLGHC